VKILYLPQVGSLVDSADSPEGRTAKYKYINGHSSAVEGSTLTRATLVQTRVELKKGDPVLVFYGQGYKTSAMPVVLDTEQT
jgi:hypothetical protein